MKRSISSSDVRRTLSVALTAALLCLCAPASAEDAADMNRQGVEAFQSGDFLAAAAAFRSAWEQSENPAARKNEAIAWFKGRDCENAVVAATSFLSYGAGSDREFTEVRSVIGNCKATFARKAIEQGNLDLGEQLIDEVKYLPVDPFAREQINLARVELTRARTDEWLATGANAEVAAQASATDGAKRPAYAWALLGSGLAVVGATAAYHVAILTTTVPNLRTAASEGANRDRYDRLATKVSTSRWLIPTLYAAGAASTAVGGVLLLVAPRSNGDVVAALTYSTRF